MRILPLMVVAAVAAPALADSPTQIVGRVVDNTKKHPVVGATVTVGGFTATTDVNGLYHLNVPAGTYAVDVAYGLVHAWDAVTLEAGKDSTVDATLDIDLGEIIDVDSKVVNPVAAKPIGDPDILPRYSDDAFFTNAWARAWLLLDIDEAGKVTRIKWLKRPGHDLDQIAIAQAFATRFTPARDNHNVPARSLRVHLVEWPSYDWVVSLTGVLTHRPERVGLPAVDPAIFVPCEGSGPWMDGIYRDCTPAPDPRKFVKAPWIVRPDSR
jgi:hypothetical protein